MAPKQHPNARDLFPGALEMMVLQLLLSKPMHGYALVQQVQLQSQNLLQVEEGSLYPALQRLLKGRLVEAAWEISASNRRVRTYRITAEGSRYLDREVSRFEQMLKGIALILYPAST